MMRPPKVLQTLDHIRERRERERINVYQDAEIRDWAKCLNTTPDRIRAAVRVAGDRAESVGNYLRQSDRPE
jgi:hypothetical protein